MIYCNTIKSCGIHSYWIIKRQQFVVLSLIKSKLLAQLISCYGYYIIHITEEYIRFSTKLLFVHYSLKNGYKVYIYTPLITFSTVYPYK